MLNPLSPLPLYQQLAEELRQQIESGALTPGARLPSEPELSRRHRIGRPTVRQATELLVRRGLIERRRGAGTFVRQKPRRVDLFSLGGTLSSFREGGVELKTRLLGKVAERLVPHDSENPFSDQRAYVVTRLGNVGARAMLLERLYFARDVFPGLEQLALAGVSLSRLVEERYYLKPSHAEQKFRVALPPADVREALRLAAQQPLLLVKRALFFPRAPRAIYCELYCRTDELIFSQTLGAELIMTESIRAERGYFQGFGGAFIPEILHATFEELTRAFESARADPSFWQEYLALMSSYSCRPTPLTFAENLSEHFGGARIYIKREDLNHTGAHKANNVMGQGLLVKRMGKKRVIAETGAGQHGVATATMAAKFGLSCTIYMGEVDVERQRPNVFWMERLGATVVPVTDGSRTLKDAINEAFRDWVSNMDDTHYVLGTACGPHPYPEMVTYFQSVIGQEARRQILQATSQLPKRVYACVGGGSNAIGIFSGFLDDSGVELVGVEAGGDGVHTRRHAARLASSDGSVGVAQGYKTYFLQSQDGQMNETHSVAAGLDYVGVSPILSHFHETKRARFEAATDTEVVEALKLTIRKEGLIPALESSHAFAQAFKEVGQLSPGDVVLINQSGRGDKDIFTVADAFKDPKWEAFIQKKAESYRA